MSEREWEVRATCVRAGRTAPRQMRLANANTDVCPTTRAKDITQTDFKLI
jgi:hypothetical protein